MEELSSWDPQKVVALLGILYGLYKAVMQVIRTKNPNAVLQEVLMIVDAVEGSKASQKNGTIKNTIATKAKETVQKGVDKALKVIEEKAGTKKLNIVKKVGKGIVSVIKFLL